MSSTTKVNFLSPFQKWVDKLQKPLSSTTSLESLFNALVATVRSTKERRKMDSFVVELNPSIPAKHRFLALKSIQYGFSTSKDCPGVYQDKWDKLSDAQFKAKIEKILKKIAPEMVQAHIAEPSPRSRAQTLGSRTLPPVPSRPVPPRPTSKGIEIPVEKSPSSSPAQAEATPSSSPSKKIEKTSSSSSISGWRKPLAKLLSPFSRQRSDSSPSPVLETPSTPPSSPPKQLSPISEVVARVPSKEKVLAETTSSNGTSKAEKQEVEEEGYYWPKFNTLPEELSGPLNEFSKTMMRSTSESAEFQALNKSLSSDEDRAFLKQAVNDFLKEVVYHVDIDLKNFEALHRSIPAEFKSEEFKRKFIACSYLIHLYKASLNLDEVFLNNEPKPAFIDKMQTLLHLETQLHTFIPQITKEKWPILNEWVADRSAVGSTTGFYKAESILAYEYLRKKTMENNKRFFMTLSKFEQNYRNDPMTQVGLTHRTSAKELPSWILPWLGDMIKK